MKIRHKELDIVGHLSRPLLVFSDLASMGNMMPNEGSSEESVVDDDDIDVAEDRVKRRDKFAFMLGLLNIGVSCFILGHSPALFFAYYTPKALTLIPFRWARYKTIHIHYYIFDFCYYANLLLLYFVWVNPGSVLLFRSLFVLANGPLAWAVVTFRNSLVLHSADRTTSVFIHISPPMVLWGLRWYSVPVNSVLPTFLIERARTLVEAAAAAGCQDGGYCGWLDLILPSVSVYMYWAVFYYLWVFCYRGKHVAKKKYVTLFSELMADKKSLMSKICSKFSNPWLQKLMYLCMHLTFTLVVGSFTVILWNNFWLHTGFLFTIVSWSCYNGGSFYMEVFAKKYLIARRKKAEAHATTMKAKSPTTKVRKTA